MTQAVTGWWVRDTDVIGMMSLSAEVKSLAGEVQEIGDVNNAALTEMSNDVKTAAAKSLKAHDEQVSEIKIEISRHGDRSLDLRELTQSLADQVIAEAQLTREVVRRTRKAKKAYVCYFYIKGVTKKKENRQNAYSRAWYIDQWDSHVRSNAKFDDNEIVVKLGYGVNSRVVGRPPPRGLACSVKSRQPFD